MLFFWEKDENGKWIVKRHWLAAPGKEIEGAALQRRGGEESEFLAGAHGSSRQTLVAIYELLLHSASRSDFEIPERQAAIDACEILERALAGIPDARERGPAGSPAPAVSDKRETEPKAEQPDFTTCLVLAIELLKKGVSVIDMHPWGLRLQSPVHGKTWTVGAIPEYLRMEYRASLLPPAPADAAPKSAAVVITDDPNAPVGGAGEPVARVDSSDIARSGPSPERH